jgi:hypothetical protein
MGYGTFEVINQTYIICTIPAVFLRNFAPYKI